MCTVFSTPIFCSSLALCFLGTLLRYFLNNFEMTTFVLLLLLLSGNTLPTVLWNVLSAPSGYKTVPSFVTLKLSFPGTTSGRFSTRVIPSRFCSDFSYVVYLIISCLIYKRSNLHLGSCRYLINFRKCHPWAETITQAFIQFKFRVCKSVHHHTIQINQPTRCNNFSSSLLDIYLQLNMFRASARPSSGAQQLQ